MIAVVRPSSGERRSCGEEMNVEGLRGSLSASKSCRRVCRAPMKLLGTARIRTGVVVMIFLGIVSLVEVVAVEARDFVVCQDFCFAKRAAIRLLWGNLRRLVSFEDDDTKSE
jgi:hypothetical protein